MNKTVRIIVTILGGWFGLHKFIDKKIEWGFFTFSHLVYSELDGFTIYLKLFLLHLHRSS